ncbi:hypothetical protein QZH41_001096 [Actinostola sp. cb2023]|nr:hypothetical protein QZH41_001096 [Actinostola sp. cb2023]
MRTHVPRQSGISRPVNMRTHVPRQSGISRPVNMRTHVPRQSGISRPVNMRTHVPRQSGISRPVNMRTHVPRQSGISRPVNMRTHVPRQSGISRPVNMRTHVPRQSGISRPVNMRTHADSRADRRNLDNLEFPDQLTCGLTCRDNLEFPDQLTCGLTCRDNLEFPDQLTCGLTCRDNLEFPDQLTCGLTCRDNLEFPDQLTCGLTCRDNLEFPDQLTCGLTCRDNLEFPDQLTCGLTCRDNLEFPDQLTCGLTCRDNLEFPDQLTCGLTCRDNLEFPDQLTCGLTCRDNLEFPDQLTTCGLTCRDNLTCRTIFPDQLTCGLTCRDNLEFPDQLTCGLTCRDNLEFPDQLTCGLTCRDNLEFPDQLTCVPRDNLEFPDQLTCGLTCRDNLEFPDQLTCGLTRGMPPYPPRSSRLRRSLLCAYIAKKARYAPVNLRTLDGNDTFHGRGMIATITPGTRRLRSVPRRMEHGIAYTIITFDQPLWWKAFCLINTETANSVLRRIIVRLGGFHTQMSFLGSIGHLMAGSGLKELLELIYAPNAVEHLLAGKAVARAVRGHLIVDAALNAMMYSAALGAPIPHVQTTDESSLEEMETSTQCDHDVPLPDAGPSQRRTHEERPANITALPTEESDPITDESTTEPAGAESNNGQESVYEAKSLYTDLMENTKTVEEVTERTANWELHLQVVSQMLPYFAASGHNLYTKCAYLYLQSMKSLKDKNPEVYQEFVSGYHVVRRTDRLWAGLSTDLIIEQVLMRSLKTTGGLTRGSGMTERQRLTWLLSMPACAETNCAMQELTGVQYNSSEQNKDMTKSRQKRDMDDAIVILKTLVDGKTPFAPDPVLKNIMTGVNAEESVDVDEARAKGEKILSSMAGESVATYSFKRKEQSVTLAARSSIRIEDNRVHVDPQLLFQRLVIACNTTDDLEDVFRYELCSYPAALFDTPVTLRQPQKATLADALWTKLSSDAKSGPSGNVQYVLDGGALLHRVPWPRQVKYQEVCRIYCQYVLRKYGNQTVVVFDGYDNQPSTKSI